MDDGFYLFSGVATPRENDGVTTVGNCLVGALP